MNSVSPGKGRGFRRSIPLGISVLIIVFFTLTLAGCSLFQEDSQTPSPPPITTAGPSAATATPPGEPQSTPTSPTNILGPAPIEDTTFRHDPFAKEQCGTCHDLQNQQDPTSLWASSIIESCRLCHWREIDEVPTNVHKPFPEGQCLTCHDPHASGQAFLLQQPQAELCAECHTTPQRQTHPSVAEDECLLCHAGHGSEQQAILREPQTELCARCHADHIQEAAAFRPHAEQATDCALCHDPHTGEMVEEVASEGCRQCHEDVFTAEPAVSHAPVEAGFCLTCHDFHQREQFALLSEPQPDVCRNCHGVGDPVEQTHPPDAQGECALCHAGHGGEHEALLRRAEADVCATCHEVSTHGNVDATFHFQDQFQVDCTACHNPHGPAGNLALVREEIQGNEVTFTARTGADSFDELDDDNQDDVCATCHTETSHNRVPSNREEVEHFESGTCTLCHSHNFDDQAETVDGFLLNESMCSQCHGTPPPPGNAGYELDEADLPHPLHAGEGGFGYDCVRCHDIGDRRYAGHNTTPASFQDVWFDDFNPNGSYDTDERSCGGVYCHSDGAAARSVPGEPAYASPVWTEPESGACGTCHGIDEDTLTTVIHPQHLGFAECTVCHAGYEESTHVNKQVDFADGQTLAETEACTQCHGDRAAELKQPLLPSDEGS